MAAKTFLEKNDLPQVYLDEVVAFINKNTEGVTLGAEDSATYVDPYTGASRYQSNSSSVPTSGSGGAGASYTDPWSGRTLNAGPSSLGAPSSSSAAPPSNRKSKPSGILPVETYLSFKTANLPALGKKLFELDGEMAEGVRMGEGEEKEGVQRLVSFLEGGGKGESRVREADLKVLLRVVERWEAGKKFPRKHPS
jgi:phospholipase A-2-activating protein